MTGRLVTAQTALESVLADVYAGRGPELWRGPDARWNPVELGPGLVAVLAGAPGAGKTALALQWTADVLLQDTSLAAFVASCEMTPATMARRLLARYSGVSATALRFASITGADADGLQRGAATLERIADRLYFYEGAFSLDGILAALRDGEHGPGLLVLDYLQMLRLSAEPVENKRLELDSIMAGLRTVADAGAGILAVSAVARGKSSKGNSYNALNLASFKDSGGVEYGADSCWILHKGDPDGEGGAGLDGLMVCECVKNRHGETVSLPVIFDKTRMTFGVLERMP